MEALWFVAGFSLGLATARKRPQLAPWLAPWWQVALALGVAFGGLVVALKLTGPARDDAFCDRAQEMCARTPSVCETVRAHCPERFPERAAPAAPP